MRRAAPADAAHDANMAVPRAAAPHSPRSPHRPTAERGADKANDVRRLPLPASFQA
ncbi:hypothetical protein C7S16_5296 [Burkholderia thailandensis]|uniref:Uncharacterized protein n=1 Tax=Burkholderia thailandensis TaxID=57975 RepID=A0AAW9CV15_BURTH|nr:hypothetical protein [Burkholderia thailandensis]MDW9251619.1 hypothetical protein [Burkholderia thailandensis]